MNAYSLTGEQIDDLYWNEGFACDLLEAGELFGGAPGQLLAVGPEPGVTSKVGT